MAAQHLAQRLVHEVGDAVVAHGAGALLAVHPGNEHVAQLHRTFHDAALVAMDAGLDLHRVFHHHAGSLVAQLAGVAHLAAAFGVERRVVQHDHHVVACLGVRDGRAVHVQGRDLGVLAHQVLVAVEGGGVARVLQAGGHLELGSGAGLLTLAVHGGVEARLVHGHTTLAADVGRQVQREAEGVVQLEGGLAVDATAAPGVRGECGLQDLHAVGNGLEEAFFFLLQHLGHAHGLAPQFGVGVAHLGGQGLHQLVEEGLARAQLVAVADGTAGDAAQHVATAFVARNHPVHHGERAGADVIGNHLQRRRQQVDVASAARSHYGVARGQQQVAEQVDLVVAVHVLQHRGQALQAHARVHTGLGQPVHGAVFGAVELHEDVVPDLDVTVAILLGATGRAACHLGAVVIEDLGARPARAGVTHHPEVVGHVASALVVTDAHDALSWQADHLQPDVVGLVVLGIDRGPELVLGQLEVLGQQLPGKRDGVVLEVVAEREVAQHLEESVVARGVAHVLQVVVLAAGADALLRRSRPRVRALVEAQEHVLELVHACVREQQRGVVARHHGAGGHGLVALGLEELQEGGADVGGFHGELKFRSMRVEDAADEGSLSSKRWGLQSRTATPARRAAAAS